MFDLLWNTFDAIIDPVSNLLIAIRPNEYHENHFFLTPKQHAFEIFLATVVFGSCVLYGLRTNDKASKKAPTPYKPLHLSEHIFRVVLTANIVLQLIYKTSRGWYVLGYMLQPCHMTTCLYLFCLYTKDHDLGSRVFQVAAHYMFFTALALAVPDLASLKLPGEQLNFWVQHWALLGAPLVMLFVSRRYHPMAPSLKNSLLAIGIGGLFHFDVQLPLAMVTGVNINYMLWPPPGIPAYLSTKYYRYFLTFSFVTLAYLFGHILIGAVSRYHGLQVAPTAQNTSKQNKQNKQNNQKQPKKIN